MTLFNLKPVINKRNGQINFSLRKKDLPINLKRIFNKNPQTIKLLKMKLESYE